jgi:hypothetical protein
MKKDNLGDAQAAFHALEALWSGRFENELPAARR